MATFFTYNSANNNQRQPFQAWVEGSHRSSAGEMPGDSVGGYYAKSNRWVYGTAQRRIGQPLKGWFSTSAGRSESSVGACRMSPAPVLPNQGIQHVAAADAPPAVEAEMPAVIEHIVKLIFHHQSATPYAPHGEPPFTATPQVPREVPLGRSTLFMT